MKFVIWQYLLYSAYTISNPVIYESFGENQIVRDEGGPVLTPSGREFVSGVDLKDCARLCWRQDQKCGCCNSFSYRTSDQKCYLKNRAPDAIDMNYTDSDGFQTYKFYPLQSGPFYDGNLPVHTTIGSDLPIYAPFQSWYTTKGEGKSAQNEGTQITSNGSPSEQSGVSAATCATTCESIQGCEGFSYNPNQNGGKCFFKTSIPQDSRYITQNSAEGWTFYWKEFPSSDQTSISLERQASAKCYCSCKSQFTCVHCYQGVCCEIDGRLTC